MAAAVAAAAADDDVDVAAASRSHPHHRSEIPHFAEGSALSTTRHYSTGATAARGAARRLAGVLAAAAALAAALLVAHPAAAHGQQTTGRVNGTITGDANQPLAAVQVQLVGTGLGAATGDDGRYTISGVAPGTYTLRAQRIGYAPSTQQVTVAADQAATVDLQLRQTVTTLTTQVVVGYTTQQKRDVSDATAGVRGDEIRDQKVATVEEALRGRIPGVQIAASGEPGRAPQIIIRGQNFFTNPSPLYVVDGMYMQQNPNLNPDEIESVEVLKDASAAAQYGAQAANGVVVMRTKRGRAGPSRVEVNAYYGYQDVPTRIDLLGAREWAQIQKAAIDNANANRPANRQIPIPSGVTAALSGQSLNVDWQDAILQNGAIQNYNLGVSGGSANASYLLNGGFLNQEGAIVETGFKRYSLRGNLEQRRGRFAFGENLAISRTNKLNPVGAPLLDALRMPPTVPVRDPANPSGWGYGSDATPTFGTNPVAVQFERPQRYRSNQAIGSVFGDVRLIGDLHYRLNLGVNYNSFAQTNFMTTAQVRYRTTVQFAELAEARGDFTSLLAEHLLRYESSFSDKHRLNAVAGYTSQRQDFDSLFAFRMGFPNEDLRTIDAGLTEGQRTGGPRVQSRLEAVLVRANYTLLDRYILTGSLRRDGSSRFGKGNQYGDFGAASVGWVLSEEPFFRSIPGVRRSGFLKLRASYGELGNQDIGDYQTSAVLDQNRNYIFGGTVNAGTTQLSLANPSLQWQSNAQTNFGLDLGLMGERLLFTVDRYISKSSQALVGAPIPLSLGANNSPTVNAARLRNTGTEFGLTHRWERGDFRLNSSANFTTQRNRVVALGTGSQALRAGPEGVARSDVGHPVGSFYVVQMLGIFQSQAEIDAYTATVNGTTQRIQPNARPGDIKYADLDGDGSFNYTNDRYYAGSGTPRYTGGLFLDGGWKAVDVGLNIRGAGGFKIFNAIRFWTDRLDEPTALRAGVQWWTPENRSNTAPRPVAEPENNNNILFSSDRWIEDGDYVRIQNVVLGYTLPTGLTRRFGATASAPRLYVNVQNLHTFTDFTNWDPESLGNGGALERGIDDARIFPNVRTVTFGLDLRF